MTNLTAPAPEPGTLRTAPRRSRKVRRWWLAFVALAAAIAVVTDLSSHAGPQYHRTQLRGFLSATAGDVAQCQAGLRDAVDAVAGWAAGRAATTRSVAATFTRQAIAVCGFADQNIIDLAGKQPPRSIASPVVDHLAPALARWAYLDAFDFLQDLEVLIAQPASQAARGRAEAGLHALSAQRARFESLAERAERAVQLPAKPVPLVKVAALLPGGSLPALRGR